jgi:uncharacterized protein (TIGR03437 family)
LAFALGDFNRDGRSDVAILFPIVSPSTNETTGTSLQIFLGSSSGNLVPGPTLALSANVTGLYVGDFDGDGMPDLVAFTFGFNDPFSPSADSSVHVLRGNGDGSFSSPIDTPFAAILKDPGLYSSIIVADVNRDGKADLFAGPQFFLNKGDGTFQVTELANDNPVVFVADLNHDGNLDIVRNLAPPSPNPAPTGLSIGLGNGSGSFFPEISIPLPFAPLAFIEADFNGDGYPDLAVAGLSFDEYPYPPLDQNGIAVVLGKADGSFEKPLISPGAAGSSFVSLTTSFLAADFNHDGKLDLLGGNGIMAGNGDGTFQAPVYLMGAVPDCNEEITGTQAQCGFSVASAVAADFNRDGLPDLVLSYESDTIGGYVDTTTSILLNDYPGSGFLSTGVSSATGTGPVGHESLVSAYGIDLAPMTATATTIPYPTELGGIRLHLRDTTGLDLLAPLLYVSSSQINYLVPKGLADYLVSVSVERIGEPFVEHATALRLERTVPSIFTMNADGLAAATAIRINPDKSRSIVPVVSCPDKKCMAVPIDVTKGPVYLSLYGTGFTDQTLPATQSTVAPFTSCRVNAANLPDATYSGPQLQIPGLDQINVLLPASLAGSGDSTLFCWFYAEFATTNIVHIAIK